MARRRYVSTDVSIDKRLNKLAVEHGDFAALLYTWMVPHANDDATLNGDIDEFMATVLPMRRDKTAAEVEAALRAMCHAGLIGWDGTTIYFPVAAFYRYQTYIAADKRRTADVAMGERPSAVNADDQRETPPNAEECRGTAENAVSVSPSVSPSPSVSVSGAAARRSRKTEPLVPLSEEEKGELREKWRSRLPDVDDRIELALAHDAHWKYPTGQKRYVDNWLLTDWEKRNGNGRAMGTGANGLRGRSDPQDDPKLQELRRLGVIIE